MITGKDLILKNVADPKVSLPRHMPKIPDEVYGLRLKKVLRAMEQRKYEYLILYGDREHFSNFEYLVGFEPRFEEGILILSADGTAALLLGNECFVMCRNSRLKAKGILYQALSLPGQPIDQLRDLGEILAEEGLREGVKTGIVGWKLMYPRYGHERMFDVPSYIVEAVQKAAGKEQVSNATDLFIHPEYGVRMVHTAAEIAALEFGAAYASDAVRRMLAYMRPGMTELEISMTMGSGGLEQSCFPMMSSGERTRMGLVSPSDRELRTGDPVSCSQGLRGGLTCRAGYAAYTEADLPADRRDFVEKLAAPYFATVVNWMEQIRLGACAGDIFRMVQSTFPKETYGWVLNPGHFIATEEWSSSPFYEGSRVAIRSGMCIQMDIIPGIDGYAGVNCEDGLAVADEALRDELKQSYPEVYDRMQQRRDLAVEQIGIKLAEEVLPLSGTFGLYRPYLLNHSLAFSVKS
ncbi:MAG: M24 family metallopeptidase [Lachnospiraceae bacterium]|nr:M24 family metallopeptidase [Lachnospiraceae bacterium]